MWPKKFPIFWANFSANDICFLLSVFFDITLANWKNNNQYIYQYIIIIPIIFVKILELWRIGPSL